MKINEKNLYTFANSPQKDKEGYMFFKRSETKFHKRWFVLKSNLLFYFEKKGDKEPCGLLLLEGCTVELSSDDTQQYCFQLVFITPGEEKIYYLAADSQTSMEAWMKAIACASYDYMRLMIAELKRQLEEVDSRNKNNQTVVSDTSQPKAPPRRQNPFNKLSNAQSVTTNAEITKTAEFLEPIKDEMIFESLHQEIGKTVKEDTDNTTNN